MQCKGHGPNIFTFLCRHCDRRFDQIQSKQLHFVFGSTANNISLSSGSSVASLLAADDLVSHSNIHSWGLTRLANCGFGVFSTSPRDGDEPDEYDLRVVSSPSICPRMFLIFVATGKPEELGRALPVDDGGSSFERDIEPLEPNLVLLCIESSMTLQSIKELPRSRSAMV